MKLLYNFTFQMTFLLKSYNFYWFMLIFLPFSSYNEYIQQILYFQYIPSSSTKLFIVLIYSCVFSPRSICFHQLINRLQICSFNKLHRKFLLSYYRSSCRSNCSMQYFSARIINSSATKICRLDSSLLAI